MKLGVASSLVNVVCALSVFLMALPTGSVSAAPAERTADENVPARVRPKSLKFKVVLADNGEPVPDANLDVHLYGPPVNLNQPLKTDAEGCATFEYPDGTQPVSLWAMVRRPGLVPYYVNFGRGLIPVTLPTEKTIRLEHGKKVAGKVFDKAGQPVAGARVSILVPATDTPSEIHYHLLYETTGEDGSWMLDGAPLNIAGLSLGVEHSRFISGGFTVQDSVEGRYVLDPGLQLKGRIVDEAGQPIPDAHVTIGRDRWGSQREPVRVEKDGSYTVYALSPETTCITAESPKFAPQVKPVTITADMKPIEFELKPGHTTRFKVVNLDGSPIQGIRIVANSWNGYRSLWWQGRSAADGSVQWDGAPDDAVQFHLVGEGYAAVRDVMVTPRDEPYIVEVPRPLKIEGVVTDTKKQKVPEFRVVPGQKYPANSDISWNTHSGSTGRNGKFEIVYNEKCENICLRIEAPGYREWISEPIPFQKSEQKIFVRLEPSESLSGIVRSPDGKPLKDVRLTLITKSEGLQFGSGYRPTGGRQTVVSDGEGRFQFNSLEGPIVIVALHDQGYAEITADDMKEAGGIQLESWASVEVIARRGKQPFAGASINVEPDTQERQGIRIWSYGINGNTDAEGRILFNRVIPRDGRISIVLQRKSGDFYLNFWERSVKSKITPGAKIQVELGGSGSVVTGQLTVAGKPPANHEWSQNNALTIGPVNADRDDISRNYTCLIQNDGSFRIEDVAPGKYRLNVPLTAIPEQNRGVTGAVIGRIEHEFEVPETDEKIDLGTIEGKWTKRPAN